MNFLMTFVVGQSFLSMMCVMKWGIFLFFAGMVCLMSAFVLIVLPETQGIPLVCSTQAHFDFCSQEGVLHRSGMQDCHDECQTCVSMPPPPQFLSLHAITEGVHFAWHICHFLRPLSSPWTLQHARLVCFLQHESSSQ